MGDKVGFLSKWWRSFWVNFLEIVFNRAFSAGNGGVSGMLPALVLRLNRCQKATRLSAGSCMTILGFRWNWTKEWGQRNQALSKKLPDSDYTKSGQGTDS